MATHSRQNRFLTFNTNSFRLFPTNILSMFHYELFWQAKIKLIFEFVSVFRLVFSCFTAPGPRKTPKKNHKNTETNYKINKEKMYSLADRQSQQKTTFLEQILKWTETVATKIKNNIVHRTILSLLWLETFHLEGIILFRLEGITLKRGYISVKRV